MHIENGGQNSRLHIAGWLISASLTVALIYLGVYYASKWHDYRRIYYSIAFSIEPRFHIEFIDHYFLLQWHYIYITSKNFTHAAITRCFICIFCVIESAIYGRPFITSFMLRRNIDIAVLSSYWPILDAILGQVAHTARMRCERHCFLICFRALAASLSAIALFQIS